MSQTNTAQIIKLAVMAVGGQGGGVLTQWIEQVARASGYCVQATSVAGVSQRTGATIYYLEMAPLAERTPVFSLVPAAGDVDIVIAAELMEVGRSILRQFVTPERTTLIGSTHRLLAVSEKTVPGDGIAHAQRVIEAAHKASRRCVLFDMERVAVEASSVISASLLGGLAGSGALPFEVSHYREAIRASKKGVEASLAAFERAYQLAQDEAPVEADEVAPSAAEVRGGEAQNPAWQALQARLAALPNGVQAMAQRGLEKVVDFQDIAYGEQYLAQLEDSARADAQGAAYQWTCTLAKYLANAMAYDDVIRVADVKTRRVRQRQIAEDMRLQDGQLLQTTEFMHPKAEEITGLLPHRWAEACLNSRLWMGALGRLTRRGRRYRSDGLAGFLLLYALAGLRGYRRRSHRHQIERQHWQAWLQRASQARDRNYALGVEILRCRRLIKGYSDTHRRGLSKFDRVMQGAEWVADFADAADWVVRLREAALADEQGEGLNALLADIQRLRAEGRRRQRVAPEEALA